METRSPFFDRLLHLSLSWCLSARINDGTLTSVSRLNGLGYTYRAQGRALYYWPANLPPYMAAVGEVQASQGAFCQRYSGSFEYYYLTSCGTAHAHAGVASIAFVLYDILLNVGDEVRRKHTSSTHRHNILRQLQAKIELIWM